MAEGENSPCDRRDDAGPVRCRRHQSCPGLCGKSGRPSLAEPGHRSRRSRRRHHSHLARRARSTESAPRPGPARLPLICPLDEAVENALLAGLVEIDGELVAVDPGYAAIAELLVKH